MAENIVLASRWVLNTLQAAQTTGNGVAMAAPSSAKEHTFYIQGSAGVATGAIQIESSDDPAFAGTWAPLGSPITVLASSEIVFAYTGTLVAVRARISTNITGGTVTVTYKAI